MRKYISIVITTVFATLVVFFTALYFVMPPRKRKATTDGVIKKKKTPSKASTITANTAVSSDSYYHAGNNGTAAPPSSQAGLTKLFDKYRDDAKSYPDRIGLDGAQAYLADLNIALDDIALLCLCELLQCSTLGEFEREPFLAGWQSTNVGDNLSKQSSHIGTLRKRLSTDGPYFKKVYRYAFNLAKPAGQRSVPVENAVEFWAMFFSGSKGGIEWNGRDTAWLDEWLAFYESKGKKLVNKDLWNMVYELVLKTKEPGGEDLSWWNEDGAWPMAVDDFVAHIKETRGGETVMDTT